MIAKIHRNQERLCKTVFVRPTHDQESAYRPSRNRLPSCSAMLSIVLIVASSGCSLGVGVPVYFADREAEKREEFELKSGFDLQFSWRIIDLVILNTGVGFGIGEDHNPLDYGGDYHLDNYEQDFDIITAWVETGVQPRFRFKLNSENEISIMPGIVCGYRGLPGAERGYSGDVSSGFYVADSEDIDLDGGIYVGAVSSLSWSPRTNEKIEMGVSIGYNQFFTGDINGVLQATVFFGVRLTRSRPQVINLQSPRRSGS